MAAKIEVEGFAQLKADIASAKSELKALNAEMVASEAEFKATGDAQKYMDSQSQNLNEQISQQEKILASSREAMSKLKAAGYEGSSAYTQMRTAAANAEAKIYTLKSRLNDLHSETDDASEGVEDVSEEIKDLGENAGEAGDQVDGLGGALGTIANQISLDSVVTGLGKVRDMALDAIQGIINIGKALWESGVDAANWADDLATAARNAGNVNVEDYQRWLYASEIIDVSVDDIVKAQDKLIKSANAKSANGHLNILDFLAEESRAAVKLSSDIANISLYNNDGSMKSANDLLWDTVDALSKIADETARDTIAQQIFGKSFREVYGLFEDGAQEKFNAAMKEITPLTEDQVSALTDLSDAMQKFNYSANNAKMTLLSALAPSFERIAGALSDLTARVQAWASSSEGTAALERFGDAISTIITNFTEGDLTNALDKLTGWVSSLTEKLEKLKGVNLAGWAKGIGIAIGGIYMAEGVASVLKVIEGIKSLTGMGKTNITAEVTQVTELGGNSASILGGLSGKLGVLTKVLGAATIVWKGINSTAGEGMGDFVRKNAGYGENSAYSVYMNEGGPHIVEHGLNESDADIIARAWSNSMDSYWLKSGIGKTFEEQEAAYAAMEDFFYKGLKPDQTMQAAFTNGENDLLVTLSKWGDLTVEAVEKGVEAGISNAQPSTPAIAPAEVPQITTYMELLGEQMWDAFRENPSADDWLDEAERLASVVPRELLNAFSASIAALYDSGNVPEDLGFAFWNDLEAAAALMGSTVTDGIDAAIPTVSATVARLNAVISSIGAVPIGVGAAPAGGNTTNTYVNVGTYNENGTGGVGAFYDYFVQRQQQTAAGYGG